MNQAVSEWKISTARCLISKILSEKIAGSFRAVCCCAQGVCTLRELARKRKTSHTAPLKCKHSMGFGLFQQTAFWGKFVMIHGKCWWKTRIGYCQTQDTSLSRAGGKYLFCLTLEWCDLGLSLLRWVPWPPGGELTLRQRIPDGSSSGSLRICCPQLPALSLCQRLLARRSAKRTCAYASFHSPAYSRNPPR